MGGAEDLALMLEPIGASVLQPGEELRGLCAATEVKTFSGGTRAVVVTDGRVVVQSVDRLWRAKGRPLSIAPADLASVKVSGLADDWMSGAMSLANDAGYTLRLKLLGGQRLKLVLMAATGKMLGPLSGGECQRAGAEALLAWLRRAREGGEHAL